MSVLTDKALVIHTRRYPEARTNRLFAAWVPGEPYSSHGRTEEEAVGYLLCRLITEGYVEASVIRVDAPAVRKRLGRSGGAA